MYRTSLHFGWKPDLPDHRDIIYQAPRALLKKLPYKIDLREQCPAVYDQGELGSCTANAIAGAFQFELIKQRSPSFVPSRLFIYYNERSIENHIQTDSGAQIRDGMKSIRHQGVCTEKLWPYTVSEFAQKPHAICYQDALKHQAILFHRVIRDIDQMRACLADGYPFIFGFTVYKSFESAEVAQSGVLNMPHAHEDTIGGHAVLAVGYDNATKRFIVRNSWGPEWGMEGYFTIPYDYLLNENLSDDFWTIRLVESNPAVKKAV